MFNKYYYVSDVDAIEKANEEETVDYNSDYDFMYEQLSESDLEDKKYFQIPLFDPELSFFENVEKGAKYFLLPVDKNEFGNYDNKRFIDAGTKIISGIKDFNSLDHAQKFNLIIDYATMFGVRLNRFMNYKSEFFSCDERVLFESLIMKYRYFEFEPFYLSFNTIFKEIGIKKDRAVTIIKKFKRLDIVDTEIKTSLINWRPSTITYYKLNTKRIIELIPEIYHGGDDTEWDLRPDIEKYLTPGYK